MNTVTTMLTTGALIAASLTAATSAADAQPTSRLSTETGTQVCGPAPHGDTFDYEAYLVARKVAASLQRVRHP
jgi:hypothetical protein